MYSHDVCIICIIEHTTLKLFYKQKNVEMVEKGMSHSEALVVDHTMPCKSVCSSSMQCMT